MKQFNFQLQEYCCLKQESAALPSKQYNSGESELTFTGPIDNDFDMFRISFATNSTTYIAKVKSEDRKTWTITPALQEQVNTTTNINKYLPIKAIEPGDIPSLAQVDANIRKQIIDTTVANANYKLYTYKTTYRKNIEFVIPEERYLANIKIYARESTSASEYIEISPKIRYSKLDKGQTVAINMCTQVYELLFIFETVLSSLTIQPK